MKIKRKSVTLIEVLVGLAIMGIVSATTFLLSFSTVEKKKLEAAVKIVQADLEWARQMAITKHEDYYVDFDTANKRYTVYRQSITAANEAKRRNLGVTLVGMDYISDYDPLTWSPITPAQLRFNAPLGNASRTNGANFNNAGSATAYDAANAARIRLSQAGAVWTVTVLAKTGFISLGTLIPFERRRCFIATAAYGDHDEVALLRDFRDRYLLANKAGNALVEMYYLVSPAIAGYIEQREWAKKIARLLLAPAVWSAKKLTH